MKAVICDGAGDESVLRIAEVAPPELESGDLRIRVAAAAVNRADLLQRQGLYPPPPGASSILGLECSGEVIEIGARVGGWAPGDRAMALLSGGGYAEEVAVPAGCALRVPERLGWEEAAAVPEVFLTVFLNVFQLAGFAAGGTVLVHGGGSGIGTAAIQLVKSAGGTIVVTAGSDEKCRRCREFGADVAVNYRSGDFVEEARGATGGRGVDVVLDSIGADYLERNLAALRTGGCLILIGLMGGARAEMNLATLLTRRLQVMGSTLRSRSVEEKTGLTDAFSRRFGDALAEGRVRPVVDRVLPLERVAEAHRVMKASQHFGKIVLRVS
jgi:putative PIG3 family NAD(P)H quinone oxidoreductase